MGCRARLGAEGQGPPLRPPGVGQPPWLWGGAAAIPLGELDPQDSPAGPDTWLTGLLGGRRLALGLHSCPGHCVVHGAEWTRVAS